MPAWSGGECPDCGDYMPPNLITCQTCRALLNSDLEIGFVDIPEFVPLKEIEVDAQDADRSSGDHGAVVDSSQKVPLVAARGIFAECPGCRQELKIPRKFANAKVQCKHCDDLFELTADSKSTLVVACYVDCPHCEKRIRSDINLANQNVQCRYCDGALHIDYKP